MQALPEEWRPEHVVAAPAPSSGWKVVAVVVAVVACACSAASVGMQLLHGDVPDPVTYWLVDVICAVTYSGVVLLMLPRTRHPVVWVMLLAAVGCALTAVANQYIRVGDGLPGAEVLFDASYGFWVAGTYASFTVLPWLVGPDHPGRGTRVMTAVGTAVVVVAALIGLTVPGLFGANPFYVGWGPWHEAVKLLWMWPDRLCVAVGAVGLVRLVSLWWHQRGTAEQGFGWLAIGQTLLLSAMATMLVGAQLDVPMALIGALLLAAQAFLPAALLVVVLRQRLWGIEVAVSRLALWLLLSVAVVGCYAAIVWLVLRLLPVGGEAAGLVATVVLALAFQPLRQLLQARVDRLVYGTDSDPVSLLQRLGQQLRGDAGAEALPALAESLRAGLRLGGVALVSRDEPEVVVRVGHLGGQQPGETVTIPLVVNRRTVGELTLAAPTGERLDLRTLRVVRHISDLIAVAVQLEQTNRRLQSASARLGEVRHQERRMIRRELHDGIGPALAGVGLMVAAARKRHRNADPGRHGDPGSVDSILAEIERELLLRTDDVRKLARALLPAQLDSGDLPAALGVLAKRFDGAGIQVAVDCRALADGSGLDARHQVAVYHVATEALLNAYRHGRARHVTIAVSTEGADTVLEVVDDGVGVRPDAVPGVGLQSMRERADELGGSLELTGGPDGSGTCVRMRLPS